MGRKFPATENLSIHQVITWSLLIASIAATIAIVTSLCGTRSRKKSSPSPSTSTSLEKSDIVITPSTTALPTTTDPPKLPLPMTTTTTALEHDPTEKLKISPQLEEQQQPLKPPPMLHQVRDNRASFSCQLTSYSTREPTKKLKTSMSLRLTRNMSMVVKNRYTRKEERQQQRKKEKWMKTEDSIWKKTIILGEKCRVPDEDDTVVYDDKGNKISTYHPKTPRSLPPSRTCSFIEREAIPS